MFICFQLTLVLEPFIVLLEQVDLLLETLLAEFGARGGGVGRLRSLLERSILFAEFTGFLMLRGEILRQLLICISLGLEETEGISVGGFKRSDSRLEGGGFGCLGRCGGL